MSVFLSKFVAFYPRTAKRIVSALMPSLTSFLFRWFSLFLPHLRTLADEKRSENCVCFGTSGPSVCLHPYDFSRPDNGRSREKKFLAKRFAHAISVHCRDLEHAYVY